MRRSLDKLPIPASAKAHRLREAPRARGVSDTLAQSVRMPLGVAIQARTPEDIAVSIAAELVAWRAQIRVPRTTSSPEDPEAPD